MAEIISTSRLGSSTWINNGDESNNTRTGTVEAGIGNQDQGVETRNAWAATWRGPSLDPCLP